MKLVVIVAALLALACAEYVVAPQEREVRAVELDTTQITLDEGQSRALVATVSDQFGQPFAQLPSRVRMTWSSAADSIATVDSNGVVTGRQSGNTQVSARVSGDFGDVGVSAAVVVRPIVSAMTVDTGNGQAGTVGQALPTRLRVRVTNSLGAGVAGIPVDFSVAAGGGTLDTTRASTDTGGRADVGYTLGTVAGSNIVEARTARLPAVVARFTAQATAGPLSALAIVSGNAQSGRGGVQLAAPLVVRSVDRYSNAVAGVSVTWTVDSGGGSINPTAVTTDSQGLGSTRWTLGSNAGAQMVTAAVGGTLTATFTATRIAPVANVVVSPASDSLKSGLTRQLTATPKDSAGTALTGRPVVWTSSDSTVAAVDSTGLVTGRHVGGASITATVEGVNGTSAITVTPGAPSRVTSVVTAVPESVAVAATATLTLVTKDAAGNLLTSGGHVVAFSAAGGTSTGTMGSVTDHGDGTYTAVFTATGSGTPLTVHATIDAGPPVNSTAPLVVIVTNTSVVHWINTAGGAWTTAANWSPARVPTAQDTAVVAAPGSYVVTTSGTITVGALVIGAPATPGGARVLFASPATIPGGVVIHSGDTLDVDEAVIVGSFRNDGVVILENNGGGEVNVVLAIDTVGARTAVNNGTIFGESGAVLNVSHAPAGLVNHGRLSPGAPSGVSINQFAVAGNVTFANGSVVDLEVSGPGSYDVLGVGGAATLGDTVKVSLAFSYVPSIGDSFVPVTWSSFTGTFGALDLPTLPAGKEWQVTYLPIGLQLSVVAPPAPSVAPIQGDSQTAPVGTSVAVAPAVRLLDAANNPIAGASVTFAIASGGGSLTDPTTVLTDASGIAQVGGWQLGATPGTNTMTATVALPGISGNPVTFTATATGGARTWTGAISSDWSNAGNWSPAGVPDGSTDVTIVPAANEPVLTAASAANSLTINGGGARLTIAGQTLSLGGLTTVNNGLLVMTNPADLVIVAAGATFDGGNETGSLSAGELRVGGQFYQGSDYDARSFAATGTHRVVFTGSVLQQVTFVDITGGSYFQNMDLSQSAGINIQFDFNGLTVKGALISQPTGPLPLLYGLGRSITAGQLLINGLVVQNSRLTLIEAVPQTEQVDNVTFQTTNSFYSTQYQLGMQVNGGSPVARALTFSNLTFVQLNPGDTGHYVVVNAPSGAVIVNLPGANVTNGPAFTQTSGAVTVNWP